LRLRPPGGAGPVGDGPGPAVGALVPLSLPRRRRTQGAYWDKDGLALWRERLEEGTLKLPRVEGEAKSVELGAGEWAMPLDGIDLRGVKRVKRHARSK
jgi:ribosomal protein L15E